MDYHINGKNSDISQDGVNNNLKNPVPYIPALHKEIKDSVSFSGKADKISDVKNEVKEYSEEEREKICKELNLSEEMVECLTDFEDFEFARALSLLRKGYFLYNNERTCASLSKLVNQEEETFKKAEDLLDKYNEKGVNLTLYTGINPSRTAGLGEKEYN